MLKGGILDNKRPETKQVYYQSPEPRPEPEYLPEAPSVPRIKLLDDEQPPSVEIFWSAPIEKGPKIIEYNVKTLELSTQEVIIQPTYTPITRFEY